LKKNKQEKNAIVMEKNKNKTKKAWSLWLARPKTLGLGVAHAPRPGALMCLGVIFFFNSLGRKIGRPPLNTFACTI
jgi:hypothetical protein